MLQHGLITITHRGPVHTVHVIDIEEIPHDAPGVMEDLVPLGAGIDVSGHAVGGHALGRSTRRGIPDRRTASTAEEHLLAVGRKRKSPSRTVHGLLGLLLVFQVEEPDAVAGPGVEQLVLVVHREAPVVAPGQGQQEGAGLEALKIDLDLLGGLVLGLAFTLAALFPATAVILAPRGAGRLDGHRLAVGRARTGHLIAVELHLEDDGETPSHGHGEIGPFRRGIVGSRDVARVDHRAQAAGERVVGVELKHDAEVHDALGRVGGAFPGSAHAVVDGRGADRPIALLLGIVALVLLILSVLILVLRRRP